MKQALFILILLSVFFNLSPLVSAKDATKIAAKNGEAEKVLLPFQKTDRLIGNILKMNLERFHYRKLEVNDELSDKAFGEFLKKLDYSKQFLTQKDIATLSKHRYLMDDELISGEILLVEKASTLFKKRVKKIEKFRVEFFKKEFDFTKNEFLEVDPKKRKYAQSEKEFKDLWRKILKQQTLARYLSLLDDKASANDPKNKDKDKKKNKDKKKKVAKKLKKGEKPIAKMTDTELRAKAHKAIAKRYKRFFTRLEKDKWVDFSDKFFNAVTSIYDPHTVYLPPKKKEDFDIDISGSLEGIGAVLQEDEAYIKVVRIVPGGAAWREKGLEVGDHILAVAQADGEPVDLVEMRVDDAVRYIRGKKGSEVRLTVKKTDGTRKIIRIIRDVVEIEASFAKSSVLQHKDFKTKIGYINLPKFYRDFSKQDVNCTVDVKKELIRLKKQKVDGIILDLRNNGGGALEDAKKMSGLFIKDGPIVQIKDHTGKIEVLKDVDPSITYDGPLIIMINRFSASASEILAAALQDYKRAIIVGGEYSHGKGTVQAVLNLTQNPLMKFFGVPDNPLGALKLTIQKFYRVNGLSTQFKGVTPDVILPDPYGYMESREQDLDYSLPWDKIKNQKYVEWKNGPLANLSTLKSNSAGRIKKNKNMNKIIESVKYLSSRKDDTNISINLAILQKKDIENKKIIEKLKNDEESNKVKVTGFEASLKAHSKIKKGDEEKQWKIDFVQKKEEWVSQLKKDVLLEEAMFILNDMVSFDGNKKRTVMLKK